MENPPPTEPHGAFDGVPDHSPPWNDRRRLRDPGSRGLAALSWLGVIAVVGLVVLMHALVGASEEASASDEPSSTAGVFTLMGRYTVGAVELARAAPGEQADKITDDLLGQITEMTVSPDDHLRLALLAIHLERPEAALEQLDKATSPPPRDDTDESSPSGETVETPDGTEVPIEADADAPRAFELPDYVVADAARIRTMIESGPEALTPEDAVALRDHHGWFAEVALTSGLDSSDPARSAPISAAKRVVYALVTLAIGAVLGFFVGLALLVVLIVRFAHGKLRIRYAPAASGGSVYLETFALFLLAFVGVQLLAEVAYQFLNVDLSGGLRWLLPLILLWPLFRGGTRAQAKFALGWHRGEGVVKEIGAGLVGYLAGLPIVALGVLTTFILSYIMARFAEGPAPPPSHPIVQDAATTSIWGVISLYLLASVWAPLTEESMFRGALFHHLRGGMGALGAAALSGFIFAIIHPQGILLVPPLMCLGFNFAMMREWRGSLIGPMVAHGLHNAALVTVLIIAMS